MNGPTPLLDVFKQGEAERDVRLLAAQGVLAPRAHEQLAILVLLLEDSDPEICRAADDTLNRIPGGMLKAAARRFTRDHQAFFEGAPEPLLAVAEGTLDILVANDRALTLLALDRSHREPRPGVRRSTVAGSLPNTVLIAIRISRSLNLLPRKSAFLTFRISISRNVTARTR